MRLRIVVVGIPGVGKTTVVEKLASSVEGSSVTVFGSVMLEEGRRLKWVQGRDEMRKLPVERQRRLQRIAARSISSTRGRVVFVDTHLFIRTPEGFWPGLPFDVIRELKPTHLVLIEASPGEVLSRRRADATRYRDDLTVEEVAAELALARSFLSAASLTSGAPMLIVPNPEGKADEAARRIGVLVQGAVP